MRHPNEKRGTGTRGRATKWLRGRSQKQNRDLNQPGDQDNDTVSAIY